MIKIQETFSTTCVLEDYILPNTWHIEVIAHPNGQKQKEFFTKAVERIQYYIFDILENSIFIAGRNVNLLGNIPFKAQVHVFPDDPWDHLIAMCLYTKLNSICEEVFFVDSISISSNSSSNNCTFIINEN